MSSNDREADECSVSICPTARHGLAPSRRHENRAAANERPEKVSPTKAPSTLLFLLSLLCFSSSSSAEKPIHLQIVLHEGPAAAPPLFRLKNGRRKENEGMKDDHWFSSDGAGGQAFNVWLINSTVLSAHYHYLGDERWRQRCEGRDNDERERPPLVEPNDRDFPSPLLPLHRIS